MVRHGEVKATEGHGSRDVREGEGGYGEIMGRLRTFGQHKRTIEFLRKGDSERRPRSTPLYLTNMGPVYKFAAMSSSRTRAAPHTRGRVEDSHE